MKKFYSKIPEKLNALTSYIAECNAEYGYCPSLREIERGVGISRQTVQRYLKDMDSQQLLRYDGKSIVTKYISERVSTSMIKLSMFQW